MPSSSEKTFGERYTKARGLIEYLELIPSYAPGNPELEIASMIVLVDNINAANKNASEKKAVLDNVRDARNDLLYGDTGMLNRSAQVRDYIASLLPEGKRSHDFKKVQKCVQKMRGKVTKRKPKEGENAQDKRSYSSVEIGIGARMEYAKEILVVMESIPLYSPANPLITVAGYTAFLDELKAANQQVAEKRETHSNAIEARRYLYEQLSDRISRIKSSLAAQFGKQSNEYKDVIKYG